MSPYSCSCPECRDEMARDRAQEWDTLQNPVIVEEADVDPYDLLTFPEPSDAQADLAAQADEAWRLTMGDWNAA